MYAAKWRRKNPQKAAAIAQRQRDGKQKLLNSMREKPCSDCGARFPPWVMEFDHARGKKEFNITAGNYGRKTFERELAKCDLVCANCHKTRTYVRMKTRRK